MDVPQVISTLGEALEAMAPFAGGSIPGTNDPELANWKNWIAFGQEDAAQRAFWSCLLTKSTLAITANSETANLPDNFHKRNGIYILEVDGVDWSENNNTDEQSLFVAKDPTTSQWQVRFTGFTPTADATATLWYYYNPPKPVEDDDKLWLDGKMIVFSALTEYYRQSGELGSLDDARQEYNNRLKELLALEQMPAKGELLSFRDQYDYTGLARNERRFYSGRTSRTRRR